MNRNLLYGQFRMNFYKLLMILSASFLSATSFSQSNCFNAIDLSFENFSTCGLMVLEKISFESAVTSVNLPLPECGDFSSETKDLWYKITVPQELTALAFHVFNAPKPIPDFPPFIQGSPPSSPGLAVYTGECANLELISCFYEQAIEYESGEIRFAVINNLESGQVLYLRVWDMENEALPIFIAVSERIDFPEHSCENPPLLGDGACNILAPKGEILPPKDCGWSSSDNTIYYIFTVEPEDYQPFTIQAEYVNCLGHDGDGISPPLVTIELQMAVYSYNGTDCDGIGGSPYSDPPNNETYHGCVNGTGIVTFSEHLPPGEYVLAFDGFSDMTGNSLCYFGIQSGINLHNSSNNISQAITIYPNPTENYITVKTNHSPSEISIFDNLGREKMKINYYYGEQIDISNLSKGVYLVGVRNHEGLFNQIFIRQ